MENLWCACQRLKQTAGGTAIVAVVRNASLFHRDTMYSSRCRVAAGLTMEVVGDYQYRRSDIIGHGAFAVVFRGSSRLVSRYTCVIINN